MKNNIYRKNLSKQNTVRKRKNGKWSKEYREQIRHIILVGRNGITVQRYIDDHQLGALLSCPQRCFRTPQFSGSFFALSLSYCALTWDFFCINFVFNPQHLNVICGCCHLLLVCMFVHLLFWQVLWCFNGIRPLNLIVHSLYVHHLYSHWADRSLLFPP